MKTKLLALVATALGALVLGGGVVMATGGLGFNPDTLAKGRLATRTEISKNGIEFSTAGPTDVVTLHAIFDPAGYSGWHMHAGLTIVTVIEGSVSEQTRCHSPVVYGVGTSFIEPPMTPGFVQNTSTTHRAVVIVTFVIPKDAPVRIDAPAPVCTHNDED